LAIGSFVGYSGGADSDYRQMLFVVPFLGLALGLLIDRFPKRSQILLLLIVGAIASHSMGREQIPHVRHRNQNPMPARWINARPAFRNVPILFGTLWTAAWVIEFLIENSASASAGGGGLAGRRRRKAGAVF
jgi:hypothetical protein